MEKNTVHSLSAGELMAHMRVLCQEIGPRPPTSPQERRAAAYVRDTLNTLGLDEIQVQPFASQNSMGWVSIPATLAAVLALPIAALGGRWGKLLSGLLIVGSGYTITGTLRARPPVYQGLIARGRSQNVVARIPPGGPVRQRVVLIAHLDSQKQRTSSPPASPGLMKPLLTATILASLLGGFSFLADALANRRRVAWWQWLTGALPMGMLRQLLREEREPHIEGANDNASAVAILLGIAEALRAAPLRHTEVTLLFTGCEEVVCVGMEAYLKRTRPSRDDTYWIDLEMVGTGDLCYVTRHGVTYLTEYTPHLEMVELAERTALKHADLGVKGKEMLIMEEVSTLRRHGYKALCIAGYDQDGYLPNWHRLSDNLAHIEPDTLSRAARYTWALLHEIDDLAQA